MVQNGQVANAATWNGAFVSRTSNSSTEGKLSLQNTTETIPGTLDSGAPIANVQKVINDLLAANATLVAQLAAMETVGTFDLGNDVSTASNVTGMALPASAGSMIAEYRVVRRSTGSGATELYETGVLLVTKLASTCRITSLGADENAGVTFFVSDAGQVQYQSNFLPGTPEVSKIVFRLRGLAA